VLQTSWEITIELAPWLLLGTVIAALLHGLLPQNFVKRHLQGKGGVAKAVLLGVPLPLCSCGVIPAGLGLKKDGASDGASVGFLISTPQTGIDSILVSANFLGWPFALFKVLSATVTGLVGGFLADRVETVQGTLDGAGSHGGEEDRNLAGMIAHGMQLLRSIWGWLLFGILASAAIQIYIPESWLTEMAAMGSFVACLAVLVFSIPLYVCATASVPIAAALVIKGVPASAALVFLMAGPASNMATIGAIYRGFGKQVLGVYLATIAIGSIGFGLTFDWVLTATASDMMHEHSDPHLAEIAGAALLLLLLAWFAIEDLLGRFKKGPVAETEGVIELSVQGMTCGGCVRKLEGKLQEMNGVEAVKVQLEPGLARVQGTVEEAMVRQVIERAGFQAV
jgi:uncharacterized membrane protein YraQ (UPF0718 family)/copper chaperone CopZ